MRTEDLLPPANSYISLYVSNDSQDPCVKNDDGGTWIMQNNYDKGAIQVTVRGLRTEGGKERLLDPEVYVLQSRGKDGWQRPLGCSGPDVAGTKTDYPLKYMSAIFV